MITSAEALRRLPSWRFLFAHPAHFVALGFGAGLFPVAPGTVGTLVAFPLTWLLAPLLEPYELLAAVAAAFALGVWACGRTGRDLGVPDHGAMVWDEVAAFMLVLMFTPEGAQWQAAAFLLFRAFDIFKPWPIREFDRTLKGGFGVMFDDLIAACYALLVLAVCKNLLG